MTTPRGQRRWWWRPVRFLALLYGSVTLFGCVAADRLIFHPEFGSRRAPTGEFKINAKDGTELSAVYRPNPASKYTLWYFHGNAEDLGTLSPALWAMHEAGYSVFAVDYPGYGRSGGTPSEKSVYAATDTALEYLRKEKGVPLDRIIACGTSLGGGPAVQLAAREHIAGLVLQSAFTSAYRVMTRWPLVPFDRFKNLSKISAVECPVLIIHGDADRVVPFHHGESLYAAVRSRKTFVRVPGADHNDLWSVMGDKYWRALRTFTEGL